MNVKKSRDNDENEFLKKKKARKKEKNGEKRNWDGK